MQRRKRLIWSATAFAVGWVLTVGLGLRTLLNYESAPGSVATVPKAWPTSQVPVATDRPTLVMLAHPHCPCTRASIGELARIMARIQGKATAIVLFSKPEATGSDWNDTALRRSAAAIPGVTVLPDPDGIEARRFGAETSGHTLLFAADGRLLFSGGITHSRGHEGDNPGEDAIVPLVHNRVSDRAETLVFGCSLPLEKRTLPALASK